MANQHDDARDIAADVEIHRSTHIGFFKLFGTPLDSDDCPHCGAPGFYRWCDECRHEAA